jgi:tetratricopeptide (TPR) repeat protein
MAAAEKYMELFTEAGNLAGDLIRLDGQPAPKLSFFQKRKLKKAARLYKLSTHEAPENGALHLMLAKVLERLGEHENYLSSLQKAWLLEPGNFILIIELSGAYGFLNKHQEAISVLLEARKYYPDEPRILFNLGVSFLLIDQAKGAVADAYISLLHVCTFRGCTCCLLFPALCQIKAASSVRLFYVVVIANRVRNVGS